MKLTPIIYKRLVISKLMTQDSLKVQRKENIPLIHTLCFIHSICSGITFQIIVDLESRIYFRRTLIGSKRRCITRYTITNHIILKKEIPQSPATSVVRTSPKTVKSKFSFFLIISNTTNVFGVQLSKKDDKDCEIGWANPRIMK